MATLAMRPLAEASRTKSSCDKPRRLHGQHGQAETTRNPMFHGKKREQGRFKKETRKRGL